MFRLFVETDVRNYREIKDKNQNYFILSTNSKFQTYDFITKISDFI